MSTNVEVVRSTLAAMGFAAERVQAAVAALSGKQKEEVAGGGDEPLLTPEELRGRMRVSVTTLWRLKDLPFVKVGGRKRYLWSEVRKHLAEADQEKRPA